VYDKYLINFDISEVNRILNRALELFSLDGGVTLGII